MTIQDFFFKLDIVIATIYLLATGGTTELTKILWKKKRKEQLPIKPIYISWIIGAILMTIIRVIDPKMITLLGVFQFAFLTLLLNGGYKVTTKLYELWKIKKKLFSEED
jgi:hypothetical protein